MRAGVLALLLVAGCKDITGTIERERGNGTPKVEPRTVEPFQQIDLGGALRAEVTVGAPQSVEISGDENLVPLVTTEVKEGRLRVGSKKALEPKLDLVARIANPTVRAVSASGAAKVHVYTITGETFELAVGGAARIDASGTVKTLAINVSGSAKIQAGQLKAEDVTVSVSGSGEVDIAVSGVLDVSISGTGVVRYSGTPREVKKSISGTGKLVDAAALAPPKPMP